MCGSATPLIVCEVDAFVLQSIDPFQRFLLSEGHELLPRSFHLHGNIVSKDGVALDLIHVRRPVEIFFERQEEWRYPFLAAKAPGRFSATVDIVLLTAMPPVYADQRLRLGRPLQPPLPAAWHLSGERAGRFHRRHGGQSSFGARSCCNCFVLQPMPVFDRHRFAPAAMDGIRPYSRLERGCLADRPTFH
ncbi:hypothetical protein EV129_107249 [Rhizobium azibense]|uniref:Uncharacterized protein n=1 Tax=Rhizobium azibense TaxID=1136135 RepID=A0A4R3RMY3_9HYPH|nr:hypothetical protein EV129_107249 [Rhizobium azibense]